jgi:hypothetical protein
VEQSRDTRQWRSDIAPEPCAPEQEEESQPKEANQEHHVIAGSVHQIARLMVVGTASGPR